MSFDLEQDSEVIAATVAAVVVAPTSDAGYDFVGRAVSGRPLCCGCHHE